MGVDHNGYIGPYVRVIENHKKSLKDACADHNFPEDAEYCPKCGKHKSHRMVEIVEGDAPKYWSGEYFKNGKKCEFWDYLSQAFSKNLKDNVSLSIYIPNRYWKELEIPRIEDGKYSEEEVSFEEFDMNWSIEKFKELFSDELTYISQWFKIEVKFGYIGYCS